MVFHFPGWAIAVSVVFGLLLFLSFATHIILWWRRITAAKYTDPWDTVMARCSRGEKVGELLSPHEQVLRAECTCEDVGTTVTTLHRTESRNTITFVAN